MRRYLLNRRKHFQPQLPVEFTGTPTDGNLSTSSATHTESHDHPSVANGGVMVRLASEAVPTGVTYDSNALTLVRAEGFANTGATLWIGTDIADSLPTGANDVVSTYSGAITDSIMRVDSIKNLNQTTPTSSDEGTNGTSTSITDTITIVDNGIAVDVMAEDFFTIAHTEVNQVEQYTSIDGAVNGGNSYNNTSTAGSKSLGWSWSFTNDYGQVLAALNPV